MLVDRCLRDQVQTEAATQDQKQPHRLLLAWLAWRRRWAHGSIVRAHVGRYGTRATRDALSRADAARHAVDPVKATTADRELTQPNPMPRLIISLKGMPLGACGATKSISSVEGAPRRRPARAPPSLLVPTLSAHPPLFPSARDHRARLAPTGRFR